MKKETSADKKSLLGGLFTASADLVKSLKNPGNMTQLRQAISRCIEPSWGQSLQPGFLGSQGERIIAVILVLTATGWSFSVYPYCISDGKEPHL